MGWIGGALRELFSLFVDDTVFSVALLAWVALAAGALPALGVAHDLGAPLIFAGCAVILVASTWRAARAAARSRSTRGAAGEGA